MFNSRSLFFGALSFLSILTTDSFAVLMGHDGSAFEENGIFWQPVIFEEGGYGCKAAFPGEPRSGLSNSWYYFYSIFQKTEFEIHMHMTQRFPVPQSEEEFHSILQTSVAESDSYRLIKIEDPAVCYAAEIESENPPKLWRLYWTTDNRVYHAIIQGVDRSLASDFYDKIMFFSPEKDRED